MLGTCAGDRIVALGGGRVIDVAKALVAAGARVARAMAVPTTLVRRGDDADPPACRAASTSRTPRVRPRSSSSIPALAASQPVAELAASALNALGHAVEGPCTVQREPGRDARRARGRAAAARRLGATASPTATRSRSARCSPATRSTTPRSACTTCSRRRSCGWPASATAPRTRRCSRTRIGALAWRARRRSRRSTRPWARTWPRSRCASARAPARRAARSRRRPRRAARVRRRRRGPPATRGTPPAADRAEILALYESAL